MKINKNDIELINIFLKIITFRAGKNRKKGDGA